MPSRMVRRRTQLALHKNKYKLLFYILIKKSPDKYFEKQNIFGKAEKQALKSSRHA